MLTRILAACVGLPLLLAVVLFLPPVATAILFALACGVAAYEMLWRTGILKHRRILVYTVVAAMANVMWSWLRACSIVSEQTLWLCALLGLFIYFCALFCELLAAHTELRFTAVCVALFSGFVYPFLIGALVRLRGMDGGKFYILVAFLLEGAVGGVVCNIVFLCLYTLLLNKCFGFTQVNYFYAAIYGVLGAVASIVGDLTLSVVKRQVGIKDYGNLIPGHGGILDRFDSTMLVAPLTELLILLIPFAVK